MKTAGKEKTTELRYRFTLSQGQVREFSIRLKLPEMLMIPAAHSGPDWTQLGHHQCTHCPLKTTENPSCPIAANLVELIEQFKDCVSFEEAEIVIQSETRAYRKKAPLQYGLSSLMGIVMVTSGCPVMDKLRPMVYTHLPFATPEETLYRSISMYLLAQFFRNQRGQSADWELKQLVKVYEDVAEVNRCFAARLLSIDTRDANLNALVNLDCFATNTSLSIEGGLAEMEGLFSQYLKEE